MVLIGLTLLSAIAVVYGYDCSALQAGSTGKRFILNDYYNFFKEFPSQVKDQLPANAEVSSQCRFDLLRLGDSDRQQLSELYNAGYSICVGCGYSSDSGRCHSVDVCSKGSVCIRAHNIKHSIPSLYFHGCCDPSDDKCSNGTVSFYSNTYRSDIDWRKRTCDGPICNENRYNSDRDNLIKYLNDNKTPVIVNGNWAEWGSWSTCDKSCDIGTRVRTRTCSSPAPANGGTDCAGDTQELEFCNVIPC